MSDLSVAIQLDEPMPEAGSVSEEYAWVRRAQAGDLAAFDMIMRQYEARLTRFLIGVVGNVETAQDLCQETFLSAYQALGRLQDDVRLSAWLHTIALNHARSHHRRSRIRATVPLPDYSLSSREPDVQESVATQDTVQRVLARLPAEYAQALLLQTASGLSCREIGQVMGSTEAAVKVRLLRARQAFRRAYDAEMGAQ